jgi:hypothetical protein
MSKTFDELVSVNLSILDDAQLNEHKQNVLEMSKEDIIKYLEHLIDNEYKMNDDENVDNDVNHPNLISLLKDAQFKSFYEVILQESDESDTEEISAE